MRSQRSGLIGIITGAISTSPSFGEPAGLPDIQIVQGAQRIFAQEGLTTLISDTGGRLDRVPDLVQTLLEHRVEGCSMSPSIIRRSPFRRAPANRLVLVNCYDDAGTPAVVPDDESGQYNLIKGLIERGHTRIGYLTLPEAADRPAPAARRPQARPAEAGIAFDPALVIPAALIDPFHEFDLLWDALDRLLSAPNPPTVICCGNDKMAMRVYGLLRDRGLRVPDQMSVAGYDDYRIISNFLHPGLSTVVLPYETMGARAAQRLLRIIRGQTEPARPAQNWSPGRRSGGTPSSAGPQRLWNSNPTGGKRREQDNTLRRRPAARHGPFGRRLCRDRSVACGITAPATRWKARSSTRSSTTSTPASPTGT